MFDAERFSFSLRTRGSVSPWEFPPWGPRRPAGPHQYGGKPYTEQYYHVTITHTLGGRPTPTHARAAYQTAHQYIVYAEVASQVYWDSTSHPWPSWCEFVLLYFCCTQTNPGRV